MLYERSKPESNLKWYGFGFSIVIHIGVLFLTYAVSLPLEKDEAIEPIDLTIVVNENLNGKEDEPPPVKKVDPPKPELPKPKPREAIKPPDPPKPLEQIVTNITAKVDKKNEEKPKDKEKPKEKPKQKEKKTKAEKLAEMRERMSVVNSTVKIEVPNVKENGNGKTDKKADVDISKYLNSGYKPGRSNQFAKSEMQRGLSLIERAVKDKWVEPAWTPTMKPMLLRIRFARDGRVIGYKLEESSGDQAADNSVLSAASRVGRVMSLPKEFFDSKYGSDGVTIEFTVRPK